MPENKDTLNSEKLYSRAQAAKELGLTYRQMNYADETGKLRGIDIGTRANVWDENDQVPVMFIYTQRMIDAYKAGELPVTPTDSELEKYVGWGEFIEIMGRSENYLRRNVIDANGIDYAVLAGSYVFLREDVLVLAAKLARVQIKRGQAYDRNLATGEETVIDLAGIINDYLLKTNQSQAKLAEGIDGLHRQSISRTVNMETFSIPKPAFDALMARLKENN